MGVRHANGAKGDLIAEVQIMLPEASDGELGKHLLEAAQAAQGGSPDPRAALRW